MGLFSKSRKEPETSLADLEAEAAAATAAYVPQPPIGGNALFTAYRSKSAFMIDWAASVFLEAGKDPIEHRDGVEHMARIVTFARVYMGLIGLADSHGSKQALATLNAFDRGNLVPVLDIMYPAVIRSIAASSGARGDMEVRQFEYGVETAFENIFAEARAEYLEAVMADEY